MSGKYNEGREAFGRGDVSWTRSEIVAQLVSDAYSFNADHGAEALDVVGEPVALGDREVGAGGWLKCGGLKFRQVAERDGKRIAGFVVRVAGGPLVFHCNEVVNFPMRPNGGDIEIDVPERGLFRI